MAEILSQSEIDALLSAVSSGEVDTKEEVSKTSGDWLSYDLTSQEKILRSKFAAFSGIHDRFAAYFRVTLSNMLKRMVSVNCVSTDFVKFGDYLANILLPTSINVVFCPKLKAHLIMVVPSKLTYALVDTYYGGTERPYSKIGGRDVFTGIESEIIRKVVLLAISDLEKAWEYNLPVEFELLRTESNPQFVGAIHNSEIVAVAVFEVEFENLFGPLILIIQLSALESVQGQLSVNLISDVSSEIKKWQDHWIKEVTDLEMNIRVELGSTDLSLRQVEALKKGEELMLYEDASHPLTIYVEGLPKMKGLMGVVKGNKAVRLIDTLKPVK